MVTDYDLLMQRLEARKKADMKLSQMKWGVWIMWVINMALVAGLYFKD